jgi:hypothetical protein
MSQTDISLCTFSWTLRYHLKVSTASCPGKTGHMPRSRISTPSKFVFGFLKFMNEMFPDDSQRWSGLVSSYGVFFSLSPSFV